MTLAIFDAATAGHLAIDVDHVTEDDLPVFVQRYAGTGQEIRAAVQSIGRRVYRVSIGATKAETLTVDEFWRLKSYEVTSVLFEDPRLSTRTGVALGSSVSSQVTFTLPTSGENSRDYPQAGIGSVTVYDDGSPMTMSTINVTNRTLTVTVAPTAGSTMTADYPFYRRVRLDGRYQWTGRGPNWFTTQLTLREVPA